MGHCVGWLSCPEVAHVALPAAAGPTRARRHRPHCPGRVPTRQSVCPPARPARPRPDAQRWVASRKAIVVAAARGGLLSMNDACARYRLTTEEFLSWQTQVDR